MHVPNLVIDLTHVEATLAYSKFNESAYLGYDSQCDSQCDQ